MNSIRRAIASSRQRLLQLRPYSSGTDCICPSKVKIRFPEHANNKAYLFGIIDSPVISGVSIRNGDYWAGTVLRQECHFDHIKLLKDPQPLRIPIIFKGDLAWGAASHLRQGDGVFIFGKLVKLNNVNVLAHLCRGNVQVLVDHVCLNDRLMTKEEAEESPESSLEHSAKALERIQASHSQIYLYTRSHNSIHFTGYVDSPVSVELHYSEPVVKYNYSSTSDEEEENSESSDEEEEISEYFVRFIVKLDATSHFPSHFPRMSVTWCTSRRDAVRSFSSHFKDNLCVNITGMLVMCPPPHGKNNYHTNFEVVSYDVSFVDESFEQKQETSTNVNQHVDANLNFWRDLVRNPKRWWAIKLDGPEIPDFMHKEIAKIPDFVHKEIGYPLWVNSAPEWVLPELIDRSEEKEYTSLSLGCKQVATVRFDSITF